MIPSLTDNGGLEVHHHGSGNVAPRVRDVEEGGVGGVVDGVVLHQAAIRADAVLQAVQLPARVAHLDPGLAHVNADTFALWVKTNGYYLLLSCDTVTRYIFQILCPFCKI